MDSVILVNIVHFSFDCAWWFSFLNGIIIQVLLVVFVLMINQHNNI